MPAKLTCNLTILYLVSRFLDYINTFLVLICHGLMEK